MNKLRGATRVLVLDLNGDRGSRGPRAVIERIIHYSYRDEGFQRTLRLYCVSGNKAIESGVPEEIDEHVISKCNILWLRNRNQTI